MKYENDFYLSIVIPAYNCSSTLFNAIASIAQQKDSEKNKKQIEVIVVDDCSDDDYTEVINKWNDIINISFYRLEKNSGPGVARQKGLDEARGKWITFLDADDTIAYGAFMNVKAALDETDADMLITDFYEQRPDFKTYENHSGDTVWVHGKYFKKDFIIKNNIRFHENLRTHEDIYFNHLVINSSNKIIGANFLTYIWNFKEDSITRRIYNEKYNYVETYLKDYIEATVGPCQVLIEKNPVNAEKVKNLMIMHPLYLYFYIQSFLFNHEEDYYRENFKYVKHVLDLIKKYYGLNYKDIYSYIKSSNAFNAIRNACEKGVGVFIEQQTFYEFLKYCATLDETSIPNDVIRPHYNIGLEN